MYVVHTFSSHSLFLNTNLCAVKGVCMLFVCTNCLYIWAQILKLKKKKKKKKKKIKKQYIT